MSHLSHAESETRLSNESTVNVVCNMRKVLSESPLSNHLIVHSLVSMLCRIPMSISVWQNPNQNPNKHVCAALHNRAGVVVCVCMECV
jgi:hypothetical protein